MNKVLQTRRSFLRIAILGAGILAAGCAPQATPTAAPKPTEAPAAPAPNEAPKPTEAPKAASGRLDKIKTAGKFLYGMEAQYRPFEYRDCDVTCSILHSCGRFCRISCAPH